jgi:hypothetical protein
LIDPRIDRSVCRSASTSRTFPDTVSSALTHMFTQNAVGSAAKKDVATMGRTAAAITA